MAVFLSLFLKCCCHFCSTKPLKLCQNVPNEFCTSISVCVRGITRKYWRCLTLLHLGKSYTLELRPYLAYDSNSDVETLHSSKEIWALDKNFVYSPPWRCCSVHVFHACNSSSWESILIKTNWISEDRELMVAASMFCADREIEKNTVLCKCPSKISNWLSVVSYICTQYGGNFNGYFLHPGHVFHAQFKHNLWG